MPSRRPTVEHPPVPRSRRPEIERPYSRSPSLGYEPPEQPGFIHCLAHGFPTPLARWHCHEEYELHLIVQSSGKAFVGDWIGPFQPGHLVLCGPRLPHNWISSDVPDGGIVERDLVIQFPHEPIQRAADELPELAEVLPLLERAPWHRVLRPRRARRNALARDQGRAGPAALRDLLRLPRRPRALHRLPPAVGGADAGR